MKIRLYDVGRNKKESTIDVPDGADPDAVAHLLYREVKRMKALMSKDFEVQWLSDNSEGAVYAGGRHVGSAEVVTP